MTATRIATLALMAATSLAACASRPVAVTPVTTAPAGDQRATTEHDDWLRMFARGYFPGRSGQLFFVPREGDFIIDKDPLYEFMHGSPWPYDSHIPLLLHGAAHITPGVIETPASQQDVAPTLAALLGIAPPATATGSVLAAALQDTPQRPRVIALFVLDGMQRDYFDTYAAVMPTLTRLRQQGAWFANAQTTSIPTATSIGHATIGTGTDPRVHGLVANNLFNRVTGKVQEAYEALDPGELMALTLADVWNIATEGRAIIVGQGGAIRATVGLVGHGACAINGRKVLAASYSTRDGGWETNDRCYEMPRALETFTGERYWKQAGGTWMGHTIASPRALRASAVFQRFEGDALTAVLESQPLGEDDITDLVLVNVKSPDYVSHAYGPASPEIRETLAELDRQMSKALTVLASKAGTDNLVVAITADHGMPGEPSAGKRRIRVGEVVAALDAQFAQGGASIVQYFNDPANAQIYIDEARLRELGVSLASVAQFLRERFFAAVFTEQEVRRAQAQLPLGR